MQSVDVQINKDLIIKIVKPGASFLLNHAQAIEDVMKKGATNEQFMKNAGEINDTIKLVLTHSLRDVDTGKKILSDIPDEDQIVYEDFSPEYSWDLLEPQGFVMKEVTDISLLLFFYIMTQSGQIMPQKSAVEKTKKFPANTPDDGSVGSSKGAKRKTK